MQGEKEIGDDVALHIGEGWTKWRFASEVLCDKNMESRFKGKFTK